MLASCRPSLFDRVRAVGMPYERSGFVRIPAWLIRFNVAMQAQAIHYPDRAIALPL